MNQEINLVKLQEENKRLTELSSKKDETVSISAHQIRTSLSAIKWIMKMFIDGDLGKLSGEQENLIKKVYENNERAISIISELLLINKTEDIVEKKYIYSKVDITEIIDGAIFNFFGEAHKKGIEIILLPPEKKIEDVRADKEKIRVVLENLLENAIKYSEVNGKIFINLKQIEEPSKTLEISIKDTGIGISEEGKNKIFEKFFRDITAKKKEPMGSGIGLFTVRKIIETHGGKIWFESKEKEGSTFFFTIPIFN